ncbi:MAG: DUF1588 domain-containing protein [Myxococcota bacterium]
MNGRWTLVLPLLTACTGLVGQIDDGARQVLPVDEPPMDDVVTPTSCDPSLDVASPLPARVWRLTDRQLGQVYAGIDGSLTVPFRSAASERELFDNNRLQLGLEDKTVEDLVKISEDNAPILRAALVDDVPCLNGALDEGCILEAVARAQTLLFRRPLEADETSIIQTRVRADLAEGTPEEVLDLQLQLSLAHPSAVFRTEVGDGTRLTPYEIANVLSFGLRNAPPDAALMAKAADGTLGNEETLRAEARRLVEESDGAIVADFLAQIFKITRVESSAIGDSVLEDYDLDNGTRLYNEGYSFLAGLMANEATVESVFTSTSYEFSDETELHYQTLDGTAEAQDRNAAERRGILGHPAFLVGWSRINDTDPVHKGIFMRRRLFCQEIPPPPPVQDVFDLPDDPGLTFREKLETHVGVAECAGCHARMEMLSYPLESFDPAGRYRLTEADKPIDTTGEILDSEFTNQTVQHAGELSEVLGGSPDVAACFTSHAFRFLTGEVATAEQACELRRYFDALQGANGDLTELFLAIVTSDYFLNRAGGQR